MRVAALAVGCAVAALAAGAAAAPRSFIARQEPSGIGNLVVPGDRVELRYSVDTRARVRGAVYVRNDLMRHYVRLPLRGAQPHAVVPSRVLRGRRLFYYAVLRERGSGRVARVPASGARAPSSAFVLANAVVVRLGRHRFGRFRKPEAVVARAGPGDVGFQLPVPGHFPGFGPETFVVGSDRDVWLSDGLKQRVLVWRAGHPAAPARSIPLPYFAADHDIALGPGGTLYTTRAERVDAEIRRYLTRLRASGAVLWESRLAVGRFEAPTFQVGANSPLRVGPGGTVYLLAGMPGLPGGEPAWIPVATPAGRPIPPAAQRRRTRWPFEPLPGGLRLVSELYVPPGSEGAPHELRVALLRGLRVVRAWRVLSRTAINTNYTTPALVGGEPVFVLDVTAGSGERHTFRWEYLVLRLGRRGTRARFSIPRAVYGDNLLADVRIGPDGKLYALASSPETGVQIRRYSLR